MSRTEQEQKQDVRRLFRNIQFYLIIAGKLKGRRRRESQRGGKRIKVVF